MQNKEIIILSGYNQRSIISFIRVLSRNKIPFKIIALSKEDPIYKSKYCSNIIYQRKSKELSIELFVKIAKLVFNNSSLSKAVILPSAEFLNRFLIKNRDELEKLNFEIPLVEESIYSTISDKYKFTEFCKSAGIKVPAEFNDYPSSPFVAKPKYFLSENGKPLYPYIVESANQLEKLQNNENPNDFFYQQYIGGDSIYLLFYISKTGDIVKYSQKNLMQQPNGKSIIAAKSAKYHEDSIASKFIDICKELKYFGPLMVEIKYFQNDFFLIEANPRIWGPSQLFVDANVPIFERFIVDLGFILQSSIEDIKEEVSYFWFGGMLPLPSFDENSIVFHNYNWEKFFLDFPDLLISEVYRRDDTQNIFIKEISERTYGIN